jgi:hypothetical protein
LEQREKIFLFCYLPWFEIEMRQSVPNSNFWHRNHVHTYIHRCLIVIFLSEISEKKVFFPHNNTTKYTSRYKISMVFDDWLMPT